MESGIDLNFDLSAILAEDMNVDFSDLEDVIGTLKDQEYYELKSRTVPETERSVNKEKLQITHNCWIYPAGNSNHCHHLQFKYWFLSKCGKSEPKY